MTPKRTTKSMAPLARLKKRIGREAYGRLLARLGEVNRQIRFRGIRPFNERADLLRGYMYEEFYDWDLYFENLYLSHFGVSRFCRNNLEAFLDRQLACGFVARTLIHPRERQHFKPFLAQIALLGCRQTGDWRWLAGKYYTRLAKYLDYWFWYSDFDKNGLAVWDSADHSGMDNQTSRTGDIFSQTVEGADLNTYLVRELGAMAILAGRLGRKDDARAYADHAERLAGLLNDILWDEADAFYYDRHERTGERIRVKSVAGLLPLWLGSVPKQRARRLVREHLLNEEEFWLPYPVATYARTEPDYYQERRGRECNWRGTCWVPTNYMIFQGLRKHGYAEAAGDLAYRTFEMALAEADTREYYNAETGTGQGLNPFWGWSSLAYVMPLEFEFGYDPTDLERETIVPLARDALGVEFPEL